MNFASQSALRISSFYVVLAICWIALSDVALSLLFADHLIAQLQTVKGILFVLATGALLFGLIRRSLTREVAIRELRSETEHRWRELVDRSLDAIVLIGDDRLIYCNQAAADLFGARDQYELGKISLSELLLDEEANSSSVCGGTAEADCPPTRRQLIRRLDGSLRTVEKHPTSVRLDGRRVTMSVLIDVTSREAYERRLIQAKDEAEALAALKESILTNMSHEIRTPLTGIIGIAEVLAEDDDPETRNLTSLLHESSWRLARTLDSILTMAQLQSGTPILNPQPVDLAEDVEEVVRSFRPQACERDIDLQFTRLSDETLAYVEPAALDQVVTNLVSNAVKFTHGGKVTVSVGSDGTYSFVQVRDTGIGISKEFLPYAFDEYRQESHGISRDYEGSGLGLTIAKRLVDLMNGEIILESEKGVGTSVLARLPAPRQGW